MSRLDDKELRTGALYGKLFTAYDDEAFRNSVELFAERFVRNGFDPRWFVGRRCLDAGCGGGRYSMALSSLGAATVVGVDISSESIKDARRRAAKFSCKNVAFEVGSVESLSFGDAHFDCVIHSGVLMHTKSPLKVMGELHRVLRPGGMLYGLVYATEGLRWPLVQMLRPIAQAMGFEAMDTAVARAGLPVNRRRTYLDDLFVPYIDFYSWQCLSGILEGAGFSRIDRWSGGRLDHEEDVQAYGRDLRGFLDIFEAVAQSPASGFESLSAFAKHGRDLCAVTVDYVERLSKDVQEGRIDAQQARELAIGQGHHRFVAWKE